MFEVQATDVFHQWIAGFDDKATAAIILRRIDRVRAGLLGDVRPVGDSVSELRIDYGPGYRVYFVRRGKALILLLCGGDKSSQDRDIRKAKEMAAKL
jgi:putative addiction module killer protein